jgi:hypothetical protein
MGDKTSADDSDMARVDRKNCDTDQNDDPHDRDASGDQDPELQIAVE